MLLIKNLNIKNYSILFNKKQNYIKKSKNRLIKTYNKIKKILFNFINNETIKTRHLYKNFLTNNIKLFESVLNHLKIVSILKINMTKSNYFINITNTSGNTFFYITSGLKDFFGKQKTTKHSLITILQDIYKEIQKKFNLFNNNISIHFSGSEKNLNKNIVKKIKHYLKIKKISFFYLTPHNGCKPKKIKKIKKIKVNFY